MIELGWLGSFTSLIELVGSLIPKRVKIPPTDRGIKYKGMTRILVLKEGNHWYWPFRTECYTFNIMPRTVGLAAQYVLTSEGTAYKVDGSVLISVFDSEEDILRAFYEHDDIESIIEGEANNAICHLISDSLDDELLDREEFTDKLRRLLSSKLREYGIKVHRCYIETLVTGRPLLLIGGNVGL